MRRRRDRSSGPDRPAHARPADRCESARSRTLPGLGPSSPWRAAGRTPRSHLVLIKSFIKGAFEERRRSFMDHENRPRHVVEVAIDEGKPGSARIPTHVPLTVAVLTKGGAGTMYVLVAYPASPAHISSKMVGRDSVPAVRRPTRSRR